jgi:biopolymer transport protein ExbD
MRIAVRRKRQAPAVIIISLIDILIVLLIFMMVTTTFKQHPAVHLALPESSQSAPATTTDATIVVSVVKAEPHFYIGELPVTISALQNELVRRSAKEPDLRLSIRADKEAPFGEIVRLMDAAKSAKIKSSVSAYTQPIPK